mmetsp:Transcript_16526/g.34104  ORF Transcript_16526/g.34104 Transcript_16526/m.34104 type:complete len:251 (-) Transcript_16526:1080-1832(-)
MPTGCFKSLGCSSYPTSPFPNRSGKSKSNLLSTMAKVTQDSRYANSSPTHFLLPPPKGKYAKSAAVSVGYSLPSHLDGSKPAQPSTLSFLKGLVNLSGSNLSGFSQYNSDLWMLYTLKNMSIPRLTRAPSVLPSAPRGSTSSVLQRRMRRGGSGYIRRVSAMTSLRNFIFMQSCMVGILSPTTSSISSLTLFIISLFLVSSNSPHVRTAAVVSCPAISIVIRSSRSCLLSMSAPRMSTRKRRRLGSFTSL